MFVTRTISGVVLVALLIAMVLLGNYALLGFTVLISLIGMFELYRVFQIEKSPLAIIGYLTAVVYYADLNFHFLEDKMLLFMASMILMMFVFVFSFPKYRAKQIMAAYFAVFYIAVMISFIYQMRMLEKGSYLTFLIFITAWGCDTMAYCVGMLTKKIVGKTHQMSPKLSPKKSIEGAVGGVLGAGLLTALFCTIFKTQMDLTGFDVLVLSIISGIGGLVSMVGDLTASAIKRNYDIKDYGKLIPGHGGIMDRFDSIIITAPIIYFLAIYFIA